MLVVVVDSCNDSGVYCGDAGGDVTTLGTGSFS